MPPREKPMVLILEDEARFRAFLAEVLAGVDCDAAPVATAMEARRALAAEKPDILMLDLHLPVIDGISFLEEFRRVCPAAPVVIITGFGDLASAKRAIQLDVSDFLTKPCDLGEIELAIDRAKRRLTHRGVRAPTPHIEPAPAPDTARSMPLGEIEREAILAALQDNRGNRSAAARQLGISRRALYNRIIEYRGRGFDVPSRST